MSLLAFDYDGIRRELLPGEVFSRPSSRVFTDTPSEQISRMIDAMAGGTPWRDVVEQSFRESNPWLCNIILSPLRQTFFSSLLPGTPGTSLDLGCGWGQITRPLASSGWKVTALEPSASRMAFTQASAKQDDLSSHIHFIEADYLDVTFHSPIDVILSIGVFEWVGAFQDKDDPWARQRQFLQKAFNELSPDGALVLGIENRTGLKYLLGCPDDHIGVPHVACLPGELARRRFQEEHGQVLASYTYTDAEMLALLKEAGFSEVEFFAALPDYKLTQTIVPLADEGAVFNAGMLSGKLFIPEHNGYDGSDLSRQMQESLQGTYASLAMQGIAHHFSPSFFVRAKR